MYPWIINLFTNKRGGTNLSLLVDNELEAECVGYGNINVTVDIVQEEEGWDWTFGGQSMNEVTICYKFDQCESGEVVYDPFVYYEGEEEESAAICHPLNYIIYITILIVLYHVLF